MVLLLSLMMEEDCWSYAHPSTSSRSLQQGEQEEEEEEEERKKPDCIFLIL